MKKLWLLLALPLMSSTCKPVVDTSIASVNANDLTVLMSGCGRQVQDGLMFCRVRSGQSTSNLELKFYGPSSYCHRQDACVFIKIYMPNGFPTLGLAIPKGETEISVPFRSLTDKMVFEDFDRGFWPIVTRTYFLDASRKETFIEQEGLIYLRVHPKEYYPLHDMQDDPYFAWSWENYGTEMKMTTKGRVFVGAKP